MAEKSNGKMYADALLKSPIDYNKIWSPFLDDSRVFGSIPKNLVSGLVW